MRQSVLLVTKEKPNLNTLDLPPGATVWAATLVLLKIAVPHIERTLGRLT